MTESEQKKTVLVTGHFWQDNFLLRPLEGGSKKGLEKWNPLVQRLGGTHALYLFLKASSGPGIEVWEPEIPSEAQEPPEGLTRCYWEWAPHARVKGTEGDRVWRKRPGFGYAQGAVNVTWSEASLRSGNVDVLVLDDNDYARGVDSDSEYEPWPEIGSDCARPSNIVLRASARSLDKIKELSKSSETKLTVIVTVNTLRSWGATIAPARSWDRTLTEIRHELRHSSDLKSLSECEQVIVHFGAAGVAAFSKSDKCVLAYDPTCLEKMPEQRWPGSFPGYSSIVATALVLDILDGPDRQLDERLLGALSAARMNHECGAGPVIGEGGQPKLPDDSWQHLADLVANYLGPDAGPHEQGLHALGFEISDDKGLDLLTEAIPLGISLENLATRIVVEGSSSALSSIPSLTCGRFLTIDKDEIERLSTIRLLIREYSLATSDTKPISIAVFGPPGSGKSFAVEEVSKEVCGEDTPFLTFNLSQMDVADLPRAFRDIAAVCLRGTLPVVFWDEFDSDGLSWLAHFLAPMNDGKYWDGGKLQPIGRSIFVFAGSIAPSLAEFREISRDVERNPGGQKAPDFVSRLRGFLEVKGPGEIRGTEQDGIVRIRRALLLRTTIERLYPNLIRESTKRAKVHEAVIRAFLGVKKYEYGARSLIAICAMSTMRDSWSFLPAMLPPPDQLTLHASEDFVNLLQDRP